MFACFSSFFTRVSGLINTAVFQSDFGFSLGSLRAQPQFNSANSICWWNAALFFRTRCLMNTYQNVSHANISLAGVSGVKKRCQTLGTRTKKNRLSDALIFLYLNRNPFGLISHYSKPPFLVKWWRDLGLFKHKLTLCFLSNLPSKVPEYFHWVFSVPFVLSQHLHSAIAKKTTFIMHARAISLSDRHLCRANF